MSKKIATEIIDWALYVFIVIALVLVIIVFVGRFTIVDGSSMSPTLKNHDVLIIESITPRFGTIEQGDIVVLRIPELLSGKGKYAIKRVIAEEDQHVQIADGKVFVDGRQLKEDYVNDEDTLSSSSLYDDIIVPKGCIYVVGDNRIEGKSFDSRAFGPIKADRILGKTWVRVFPFTEAGAVK